MYLGRLAIFCACGSTLAAALPQGTTSSSTVDSGISVANTATDTCALPTAAATAATGEGTSHVRGAVFDKILQVYLETTSFGNATADPNCQALIDQGVLLTNLFGIASPSQPAYVGAASGDYFGTNSDSFLLVDKNISTIVDLLEDKGISWKDYNEGLPYTGFEGYKYEDGLYERKHNLLARFDSIRLNPDRISRMQNLTQLYVDIEKNQVPQWSFVTPNLYNDGHNTNVRTSCAWTRGFVETLLQEPSFNQRSLVYVTWQANGDAGGERNHVAGILLGSALPPKLRGTTDDAYYNHYSELSTVEANWNLHTLGRWDVAANVWSFVGQKTGDHIHSWNSHIAGGSFETYLWNTSYGGVFNNFNDTGHTYVAPNLKLKRNGRTVLPAIAKAWRGSTLPDYYTDNIELPDAAHPPKGFAVPTDNQPPMPITTPITAYPYANPPPTPAPTPCN